MKKTAWITGASRGIGKSTALKLAAKGYSLALCCKTDMASLETVKHECKTLGAACQIYQCDVSNPEQVKAIHLKMVQDLGEITLLINNAGISYMGLLSEMSTKNWEQVISTNLSAAFFTCREVIPAMVRKKSGTILNISSVWGEHGASCEAAYSASKGGLNSLTKSLAKELAPSRISVNALSCGLIDTQMNANLSLKEKNVLLEEIPAGRMGTCEEAANMIFQLANAPVYLTGQIVTLDGGWQ